MDLLLGQSEYDCNYADKEPWTKNRAMRPKYPLLFEISLTRHGLPLVLRYNGGSFVIYPSLRGHSSGGRGIVIHEL